MTTSVANPKVDAYLGRIKQWQQESELLREIALDCGLGEELKWGKPCYTAGGSNVIVIQGFKAYCAVLFMKGYLLNDPSGILVKTGEHTRVGRQIRFSSVQEVAELRDVLKSYIHQAAALESADVDVRPEPETEIVLPEEFHQLAASMPALKAAFEALTPGRRRGYARYFAEPKQSKTRESRIEKCVPPILSGKGLNER